MFRKLLAAALCACLLFTGAVNMEAFSAHADEGNFIEEMENLLKEKPAEMEGSVSAAQNDDADEAGLEEAKQARRAMMDEMFQISETFEEEDDRVYASASDVDYSIWGTSVKITLPSGSYEYSSSSTMVVYYCSTFGKLITFSRFSGTTSLSTWKSILESDGCATGYETINGISTVYGLSFVSGKGYQVEYYYNYGSYSYGIMILCANSSQMNYFINNVISTLRSGSTATSTPAPTATPTPEPTDGGGVYLPAGLKQIEDEAFEGSSVVAVKVPDGCERIGARAFADCRNLEEIYIPASVEWIADDAFDGCGEDVYFSITVEDMDTYASEYAEEHGIDWAMG